MLTTIQVTRGLLGREIIMKGIQFSKDLLGIYSAYIIVWERLEPMEALIKWW